MLTLAVPGTADKLGTRLNDAAGILGHVLRRAHIDLPSTDIARQTGVWLSGQLTCCESAHFLDRVKHNCRPHTAVQSDDVRSPLIDPRRKYFSSGSEGCIPVQLNGHLRDYRQIAEIAHRADCLLQFGN